MRVQALDEQSVRAFGQIRDVGACGRRPNGSNLGERLEQDCGKIKEFILLQKVHCPKLRQCGALPGRGAFRSHADSIEIRHGPSAFRNRGRTITTAG
jgi:hypothetical protein